MVTISIFFDNGPSDLAFIDQLLKIETTYVYGHQSEYQCSNGRIRRKKKKKKTARNANIQKR